MVISPFTPLFFSPSTDRFGAKSKYVQMFARTDRIFIEVILEGGNEAPEMCIRNLINENMTPVLFGSWKMNNNKTMFFCTVSLLPCGYYDIVIGDFVSEIFKVTDDKRELAETTLIQYSMKDNRQRTDCIWWIDGMQYFFDFRVPGGFKDEGWGFGVNNEQFVTSDEDIVELYSHEYTTKIFTLGNAIGCPIWFAGLLNRILCCNYVYFDGIRYARKESSVPELNQQIEGLKSYVFNQMVQRVETMNPVLEWNNQVSIRGIQGDVYRKTIDDGEVRSIKHGTEKPIAEVGPYINMSDATPNTGTSINSDIKITVDSIHHPGGDEKDYWDLFKIKTTSIESKYIGRIKGYGQLVVKGLDTLQSTLDFSLISLRAVLYANNSYSSLFEFTVAASKDGTYILKGIDPGDVGDGKELQLFLDHIYEVDIDNIGMAIELTWVYDND